MCDQALITMVPSVRSLPSLLQLFYAQLGHSWCHSSCFGMLHHPKHLAAGLRSLSDTRPPGPLFPIMLHKLTEHLSSSLQMRRNAQWVYEPIKGNKSPGGRHVVTDNIFYPFCWFFLHYFWICCSDNMSDCFCFWFSSPLTVSCPRFVLQMFITFVVSNRTPIVNLDFSTENRYFKHLSIYYFLSGSFLQFTSAKRKWGCQFSPSLTILVPLWRIIV